MNKAIIAAVLASASVLAFAGGPASAQKVIYFDGTVEPEETVIQGQYICVFKPGAVAEGNVRAEAVRAAGPHGGRVLRNYKTVLRGFSVQMPAEGLARMQARNPHIAWCEPDQIMRIGPDKGPPGGGGGGGSGSESKPAGITRVNGGTAAYTGPGRAWVIDTGIAFGHPDLNIDTQRSANFVSRETSPNDLNGHGTHVAGTIAAILGNNIGVVGVAPGAPVVAVRVLNRRGSGAYSDVIAGVEYVAENAEPGDVANMSLGGPVSDALDAAVLAASGKVRFALAAGNDGGNAASHSPARVNGPNIYTVSAVDKTDTMPTWSNWGNPPVDYAEPGVSILSTWLSGGYNTISGTSMATPHMAGILLLGNVSSDGRTAVADPDGNPDPIGIH